MTTDRRIDSLDQCRGFAILVMIGGNFASKFAFMPWLLTHQKYGLTIAELFAPIFFFVVGAAYRLSFLKRLERDGLAAARRAALRRYVIITLIGLIVYIDHFWDALTHIGMVGLLILPFIDRGPRVRALMAVVYLALFQMAFMGTGYGTWLMERRLNGGPLGALSWGFIVLMGTLAYDWLATGRPRTVLTGLITSGLILASAGWALSLPWPGIKEAWPFTRYGMTAPYPVVASGTSFGVLVFFYCTADLLRFRFPALTPFGENPLVMYLFLGALVGLSRVVIHFTHEPTLPVAFVSYGAMCALSYAVARFLHNRQIRVRI